LRKRDMMVIVVAKRQSGGEAQQREARVLWVPVDAAGDIPA
jgi:hypothetical protein